jgi:hypothetical protein
MLNIELETSFDYIQLILFELGKYKQYANISGSFKKYLEEVIPGIEFNYREKYMRISGLIITIEI